jgi:hypothetical protein
MSGLMVKRLVILPIVKLFLQQFNCPKISFSTGSKESAVQGSDTTMLNRNSVAGNKKSRKKKREVHQCRKPE